MHRFVKVCWKLSWMGILSLFCLPGTAAETGNVPPRITEAIDATRLTTLRGNTHPYARPAFDRGAAPDSQSVRRMLLVLKRSSDQEKALRQLLDDQQTKDSPNYHKWLTPAEFGQQFGPAEQDIQAITSWLTSQGFQIDKVAAGRTGIEFSGTAGEVRQAFHTSIHQYAVRGKNYWANSSDPQIPTALVPVVAGFASLNNFPRKPLHQRMGPFTRTESGEIRPLYTINGVQNGPYFAVGPFDLATIYNITPLWGSNFAGTAGQGQTIGIVGETNIYNNGKDITDFRALFGLPANPVHIILDGPDPGITTTDEEGEALLDAEWAGATAPLATIDLVISETTEVSAGIDLSALYIVDNDLASVLTNSYGLCEAFLGTSGNSFYAGLWEQAAAQGITVLVATGDSGSAGCDPDPTVTNEIAAVDGLEVSGLASTPFNVAVGGTDFNVGGSSTTYWSTTNNSTTKASAKSYIPETTWSGTCAANGLTGCASPDPQGADINGSGGGQSNCASSSTDPISGAILCNGGWPKPAWQSGTGVPSDSLRDIPDVSLFASNGVNNAFYIVCQEDLNTDGSSCNLNSPYMDFQAIGGTSVVAPAMAGIIALVNQKTGQRQGNANYTLYALAALSGKSCTSNSSAVSKTGCIFYDVADGSNNSVACVGGSLDCSNTNTAANQYGILVDPSHLTTPAWTTTAGFDLATGLGSVNVANLVNNWTAVSYKSSSTTLSMSPSPTNVTHGTSVTATVNVKPASGSGTPSGDVALIAQSNADPTVTSNKTSLGGNTLTAGVATIDTNLLPGGTYNVIAHYAGDGSYGASDSAPVSVTVQPESSKTFVAFVTFDYNGNVTSTTAITAPYGSPYVMRADVTNSSAQQCSVSSVPCPTGDVKITANGAALDAGTFPLNSQGYTEDQPIQLNAGNYNVVASYLGDASFNASNSGTVAFSITKAPTAITVTSDKTTVASGGTVNLTANVATQSISIQGPTGHVQFYNGGTAISGGSTTCAPTGVTSTAYASCKATLSTTLTSTSTSTDNITAQYLGDTNYAQSAVSAAVPVTVSVTPDFDLAADSTSLAISAPGGTATTNVKATAVNGFTGTVNFACAVPSNMTETTCMANPTSVSGTGTTAITITTTGPHTVGSLFHFDPRGLWKGGVGIAVVGFLLLLLIPISRRRWRLATALALFALVAGASVSCGGGSSTTPPTQDPGTPAGTYAVTVTGTSGSTSHQVTLNVTVQ
jgi:Pro-kumamolisin, activation domain/Bacterial Ig-like domain (group 3)